MKKTLAILLLIVFAIQCSAKSVILAKFYIDRDYISKNICENRDKPQMHCNGKCHLKKQLAKEEKSERKLPNLLKEKTELACVEMGISEKYKSFMMTTRPSSYYLIKPSIAFIAPVFHPPPFI